jgi:hypothetical protein
MMTRNHGPVVSLVSLNIQYARVGWSLSPTSCAYEAFRVTRVAESQKPTVRCGFWR